MCVRAICPLISMGPKSQLKLQSARARLGGDKTQHREILCPFVRGKRNKVLLSRLAAQPNHPHIVSRDLDEVRVREVEVVAGDSPREVVAYSEGEVEAIEAAGHQQIQVPSPKILVVVPGLDLDLTAECSSDAWDFIRRLFRDRLGQMQCGCRVRFELNPLRQLQQSIDESSWAARGDEGCRGFCQMPGSETDTLRVAGGCTRLGEIPRQARARTCHRDQKSCAFGLLRRSNDIAKEAFVHQRIAQSSRG